MKHLFFLFLLPTILLAQKSTLNAFKNYPFPTELCSSDKDSKIAWALDEQGKRNVYVAEGPDYKYRKLTSFEKDDAQEITSLTITDDGQRVIFVRGGDHGSNWDVNLPINPLGEAIPNTVKMWSVPFSGGDLKLISEGDEFVISPNSKIIAFIKDGQAWTAALDSTNSSKKLFTTRGKVSSLEWSPDGSSLLFVSNRGDHSIVGVYNFSGSSIEWIAPSFTIDTSPRWSLDGTKIVFIRRPGLGGSPSPMLENKYNPWSIWVADVSSNTASKIWEAPKTMRGSAPTTHGGFNLHWAAGNRIVFLSYQDGWPHLYSISEIGGHALLLTPGNFMCEHISLSSDKKHLTFSVNSGNDALDIERRHVAKVSVDKADFEVITQGEGLEWAPVFTNHGNDLAIISATAKRPPMPAIVKFDKTKGLKLIGEELLKTDYPLDRLVIPKQIIFTAPDGQKIHADLFLPKGNTAPKPAIVYIHGGPPRQMLLGWHYSDYYSNAYASNQYLASLGFVVLSVNYRLGIGYGYEFHQPAHGGIKGASEYQDIKAAGLWLKKQSFVDASKIGVYGGSYGGYLTAMALAKNSDLFAAGVDIHGVHDWGANSSIMTAFQDKTEKPADYQKAISTAWLSSPVSAMDTWKSPVLIIHADDDRNVRFNQSTDLINRLEKKGIPYETMMIVDDTHHWMNWENSVKIYQATADFFVKKFMKK
ncbi:MAG: prolyl oligopeptidase family serine peptidase [Leadbetterella sp.]|nr:prolyl oligopeptidase family serine peptidase [Leadbetterella sp.]